VGGVQDRFWNGQGGLDFDIALFDGRRLDVFACLIDLPVDLSKIGGRTLSSQELAVSVFDIISLHIF